MHLLCGICKTKQKNLNTFATVLINSNEFALRGACEYSFFSDISRNAADAVGDRI